MCESDQYMKFHTGTKKYMKGIRCVKAAFTIIIDIIKQDMPKKGVRNLLTHVSPFSKERGCQYT